MTVATDLTTLVGRSPLFELNCQNAGCRLFLKLEHLNPGGSVKDRAARAMILHAERVGRLRPGGTIIESSSGNTGISLAMFAAARGYRFICVVDNHVAATKIKILRAYGAVIVRVGAHLPPDYHAAAERIQMVKELCEKHKDAYFIDQGSNPNNPLAHTEGTAEELMRDIPGAISMLIASVGTGGTISGTGRALKRVNAATRVLGVEPDGSILFGHPYQPFFQSGSGSARMIFENIDFEVIDQSIRVNDRNAFNTCRYFARMHGLLCGGSSGSVLFALAQLLEGGSLSGNVAVVLCDSGERYLDMIYDDEWMAAHHLLDPGVDHLLDRHFPRPHAQL